MSHLLGRPSMQASQFPWRWSATGSWRGTHGADHLAPALRAGAAPGARAYVSYPGTLNIKPAELLSLAVLDLLLMSSVMSYNLLMVYPIVLAMT